MKALLIASVLFVCAKPPEGVDPDLVIGHWFFKVPIENFRQEPEFFNYITENAGCVTVEDETAAEYCFAGKMLNLEGEPSEFSDIKCVEGVCHNDDGNNNGN